MFVYIITLIVAFIILQPLKRLIGVSGTTASLVGATIFAGILYVLAAIFGVTPRDGHGAPMPIDRAKPVMLGGFLVMTAVTITTIIITRRSGRAGTNRPRGKP